MNDHPAPPPAAGGRIVDIIVPVQRNAQAARRCVASVVASRNDAHCAVIVVVDPRVDREFTLSATDVLRDPRVTVLRPGQPLDYAASVNRALALHADRDVVLLQAGAEVHGDWLDRLASHAIAGVGVVATFTNAAGVASYPCQGEVNPVPEGMTPTSLDALFARANRGRSADVSGAFGPCLHVTRACISAVGGLHAVATDDGCASKIDLCLRSERAGFRSVVAGDIFVANDAGGFGGGPAHRGQGHAATGVLTHLHPGYAEALRAFAGHDPTRPFARRVDLARLAASPRPAIVFVSHAWGGGIRRYMNDLATLVRGRADVLHLEPANEDTVRLHWPRSGESFAAWFRLPDDLPMLADTLRSIGVARLHFHHVHGLPQSILQLPGASGIAYDCTLHDYFAICPQYHLVDEHGRYCGEPHAAGCAACLARRPAQWDRDIDAWRRAFGAFLRDAERVIAPSHDVATRMRRYFPALPISVWPHPEATPPKAPSIVRVVTLGNLSPEKGLRVVSACAEDARIRGLPLTFRVLGATTEPIAQSPETPVTIHGSYAEEQLPQLLAAERADVVFFPAQVPETYSYTLSVALATDTPIVASAIGALTERLAGRPHVRMLPFDADPAQWNAALLRVVNETSLRPMPEVAAADTPLRAAP